MAKGMKAGAMPMDTMQMPQPGATPFVSAPNMADTALAKLSSPKKSFAAKMGGDNLKGKRGGIPKKAGIPGKSLRAKAKITSSKIKGVSKYA